MLLPQSQLRLNLNSVCHAEVAQWQKNHTIFTSRAKWRRFSRIHVRCNVISIRHVALSSTRQPSLKGKGSQDTGQTNESRRPTVDNRGKVPAPQAQCHCGRTSPHPPHLGHEAKHGSVPHSARGRHYVSTIGTKSISLVVCLSWPVADIPFTVRGGCRIAHDLKRAESITLGRKTESQQ